MNSTPPMRRVDQLVGLDGGRAEVLADQVGPVRLDHLGPDQQAQRGEDPAQDPGHRGLAGAGRPGEHEVPGRRLAGHALPVPQPGHLELGGDLVHLALDRLQADQVVQLGQRALQRRRLAVAAEPRGQLGVGLLQVAAPQRDQVGRGRLGRAGHDPHVAALAGLGQQAAHEPPVAELVGQPAPADLLEHPPQHRPGVGVEQFALALQGQLGQRAELGRGVAGELHPVGEPGVEAGVGGQEVLHLPLVAGQDDDQVLAVVLGPLEQRLDRLVAEPVALPVALVHQAVGLVDEQHPAERGVDQLVGLDRGRAEVLADQVGPVRLDHLGPDQQAEGVEDLRDDPGHGGLAGARRAEEHEVLHGLLGAVPGQRPAPGRLHGRGDRADLVLDRGQPDHGVQLVHRLVDGDHRPLGGGLLAGQVRAGLAAHPVAGLGRAHRRAGPRGRQRPPADRTRPAGRVADLAAVRRRRRPGLRHAGRAAAGLLPDLALAGPPGPDHAAAEDQEGDEPGQPGPDVRVAGRSGGRRGCRPAATTAASRPRSGRARSGGRARPRGPGRPPTSGSKVSRYRGAVCALANRNTATRPHRATDREAQTLRTLVDSAYGA